MIYKFKESARVPAGATAEGVITEVEHVKDKYGDNSPDTLTDAVIGSPQAYPVLRSFGPADEATAFREAVRNGITYAVRHVVVMHEEEPEPVPVRALVLVTRDDEKTVYEPLEIVAVNRRWRDELMAQLVADQETFARRVRDTLLEIQRLQALIPG